MPVAVRSSATAEDLPGASFAGQQDTYLNVVGVDAVLDAVRRCWASLWTDRAVAYRADAGIPHAGTQLAVVVQRMVDAQVAGVLFTADPISGRRTRSVLDAAPGLGDAVVSGAVDPDHWVVDGRAITQGPAADACLTDRQVRELVDLGPSGGGALRGAAGHRVGARRGGHAVADAVTRDHHALPRARSRADRACASTSTPRWPRA